ncbi:single-stranded DNA-binding protein [Paraburkholderia youngii]|uniref:single-stranded DNA-binding protein n=1 Tax=Paraburkholderia youngii TaxID=2782701 RepID=UPI003D1C50E7
MIVGLVPGTVFAVPETRTSKNGKSYVSALLRVIGEKESPFVRVRAFDADVRGQLLALESGDEVCVSGPLELSVWNPDDGREPRVNVSMIARKLLSLDGVDHKPEVTARDAAAPVGGRDGDANSRKKDKKETGGFDTLDDDDVPF